MDVATTLTKLRRQKKETLVHDFARVLNELSNYIDNPLSSYAKGWSESRQEIIAICGLKSYL